MKEPSPRDFLSRRVIGAIDLCYGSFSVLSVAYFLAGYAAGRNGLAPAAVTALMAAVNLTLSASLARFSRRWVIEAIRLTLNTPIAIAVFVVTEGQIAPYVSWFILLAISAPASAIPFSQELRTGIIFVGYWAAVAGLALWARAPEPAFWHVLQTVGMSLALGGTLMGSLVTLARSRERDRALMGELRRNLREIRGAERELVASGIRSSLGETADGLAQEIHGPLTALQLYAKLAGDSLARGVPDAELKELLEKATARMDRIAEMISAFRLYARDGSKDPVERVSVVEAVSGAAALFVERFARQKVALEIAAAEPGVLALARRVELLQILVNLLGNAAEETSLRGGGRVRVEIVARGGHVEIAVEDEGGGVDPGLRKRVFEPFFTTKGEGRSGLGLSSSRALAERQGGELALAESSSGARFVVRLPRAT